MEDAPVLFARHRSVQNTPRFIRTFHRGVFAILLTGCILLPLPVAARTIAFSRVRSEYRIDASFKRIFEFFTGKEYVGKQLVLRTQPDNRNGFYFSFRIESDGKTTLPEGSVALFVYSPGTYEPTEYVFDFEAQPRRKAEVIIGLTGTDWMNPETRPVAWRLEFRDATGQPIGFKESFLWRLPKDEEE